MTGARHYPLCFAAVGSAQLDLVTSQGDQSEALPSQLAPILQYCSGVLMTVGAARSRRCPLVAAQPLAAQVRVAAVIELLEGVGPDESRAQ